MLGILGFEATIALDLAVDQALDPAMALPWDLVTRSMSAIFGWTYILQASAKMRATKLLEVNTCFIFDSVVSIGIKVVRLVQSDPVLK